MTDRFLAGIDADLRIRWLETGFLLLSGLEEAKRGPEEIDCKRSLDLLRSSVEMTARRWTGAELEGCGGLVGFDGLLEAC